MAPVSELSATAKQAELDSMPKDPFRLLSQQYVPTNIKTAFERALLFYKSDILIMRMISKLAEYPITPIEIEIVTKDRKKKEAIKSNDELELSDEDYVEIYRRIFDKSLNIQNALISIGLDYYLYQNVFPYVSLPVERRYRCTVCSEKKKPEDYEWLPSSQITKLSYDGEDFKGKCPVCNAEQNLITQETAIRDGYDLVRFKKRNLFRISIEQSEITGANRYTYQLSTETVKKIKKNDRFTLENTPLPFIRQAYMAKGAVELDPESVYHFKAPSPSLPDDSPWAWPLIVSAVSTIFYIQNMKKAMEAISVEHMDPNIYIAPAVDLKTLGFNLDMEAIKTKIIDAYKEGRSGNTNPKVFPFPVTTGLMNLNGRMFLPHQELSAAQADLYIGMGMPRGLLSGEGPYQANSIAMRVIENGTLTYRSFIDICLQAMADQLGGFFNLPPVKVQMKEFIKLDDALHKQALAGGVSAKWVSKETYRAALGLNNDEEQRKIDAETLAEADIQGQAEAKIETARIKSAEEAEIDRMASQTEVFINESQKNLDHMVALIEGLVSKGYTREWSASYVSEYMAQQTARAQADAAHAKAMEAREAYFRDRMAGATHSLNRAEGKRQMTNVMNEYLTDPQAQNMQGEQQTTGGLVQRLMGLKETERNQELKYLQQSQPEIWAQVVNILGAMGHVQPGQ